MSDLSDDDLLDALGVSITPIKMGSRTQREERIIAGFEDIQRFYEQHSRLPQHGEDCDIFERLYAVRLDQLRVMPDARELLLPLDHQGILSDSAHTTNIQIDSLDDETLLAELGVLDNAVDDITQLKHVSSFEERRAAEEVANRNPCSNFSEYKPLFEQVEQDMQTGLRVTKRFAKDTTIEAGNFFILAGQIAYVGEVGESIKAPNGENDARLRVVFSNGTESNLLRRSLQRALYKDKAGRRITDPNNGPLFSEEWEEGDIESGTIYVLRSLSDHPYIIQHRELIHKIGVTGGKVESRIANAALDPTFLMADVEIIATYKLAGINKTRLENLFHRIFSPGQLDLSIQDRFGNPVRPREWFLVPLHVIDEVVSRIHDGSITNMVYDPSIAQLVCT